MIITYIYSILLLTTAGAAMVCGLYAVQGNYKPMINRIFLLLAVSLSLWALGLAITGAAHTEQMSSVGRRLAPLGWGTISSIGLHFFILLTGKDSFFKKRAAYVLLYLPSAITIFSYTILPVFGLNADILIHTDFGWVNTTRTDIWDWFYYLYALIFIVTAFVLLISWGRQSSSANSKMQAKILSFSMLAGIPPGTATDVLPYFLDIRIPQVSAIFMLIMILACSYCISQYSFLRPENINEKELILNRETKTSVYRYISLVVILNFLLMMFGKNVLNYRPHILSTGTAAALIFVFSVFFFAIDRLSFEDDFKEVMVSIALSFLIPFMTLWFAHYGFFTSWVFIFSLMIICLLFNRQVILSAIIISSFFTQLFQWIYMPEAPMEILGQTYLLRLTIIAATALLSLYVNKIYTSRLKENADHMVMQTIISEISHEFVSVGRQNIDKKLYETLKRCGQFIQCDYACVVLSDSGMKSSTQTIGWISDNSVLNKHVYEKFMHDIYMYTLQNSLTDSVVIIEDTLSSAQTEPETRKELLKYGIRALMSVPVFSQGKIIGFICFSSGSPLKKWNDSATQFIKIVSDIVTDGIIKIRREKELNYIAYHDQLTGLPNRILFKEKLAGAIYHAEKSQGMLAVVFMDLDAFKSINDTLGHDQGDSLLTEISQILSSVIRDGDMAARFGGDEFILFLDNVNSQSEIIGIMDKIMHAAQRPVMLSGQEFFISISAGIAIYPQDGTDPDTLLKNADTAMYKAKYSGKGKYMLCSDDMKEENMEKIRLTNLLYRAVEKEQLILHYQPQIDIYSHCIVGVEALIRWSLPDQELIGPATFIPFAEQTGLIHSIGEWVLYEACTSARRWHDMGFSKLRISVNISIHQLKNPNFTGRVEEILKKTGLQPQYLELEITESVSNDNIDNIIDILHNIKTLGVSISIDDFGTEYSSLSRLKLLPIDRIKMDMQFVQGIDRNEKDKAISKVIINLAKSLDLKVIAEGVETKPQLDFLKQRMCDEVQGYYYYRPLPASEIDGILAREACQRPADSICFHY